MLDLLFITKKIYWNLSIIVNFSINETNVCALSKGGCLAQPFPHYPRDKRRILEGGLSPSIKCNLKAIQYRNSVKIVEILIWVAGELRVILWCNIEYTQLCAKLTKIGLAKGFSPSIYVCIWILTSDNQGYIHTYTYCPSGYLTSYINRQQDSIHTGYHLTIMYLFVFMVNLSYYIIFYIHIYLGWKEWDNHSHGTRSFSMHFLPPGK